jgi:hypothetical protein
MKQKSVINWVISVKAGVFFVTERRSGSSFSEGRKPEPLFSCHRYNEVRRVLLSYRSSFKQTSITPVEISKGNG